MDLFYGNVTVIYGKLFISITSCKGSIEMIRL